MNGTYNANNTNKKEDGLTPLEVIFGLIIVTAWLFVFICGILIDSAPYRAVITGQANEPGIIKSWFFVIFSFTPSNLLILSLLAGMIGAVSRKSKLHTDVDGQKDLPSDTSSPIMSGFFRGLFIYLLILSGTLILDNSILTNPTQDQFATLAGIISLFCFLISYDPSRFRTLLDRGIKKMEGGSDTGATGGNGNNTGASDGSGITK